MKRRAGKVIVTILCILWGVALTGAVALLIIAYLNPPTPESFGFYPVTITSERDVEELISNSESFAEEGFYESGEEINGEMRGFSAEGDSATMGSQSAEAGALSSEATKQSTEATRNLLIFAKPLTTDVFVPDSIDFCGEEAPLYRNDVREALIRELSTNTYLHATTLQIMRLFPRMSEIIYPILREEGVPDDIIYLAVCESALNTKAISSAKAAGIWQFMAATGRDYGLEVNDNIDERYNIEKATRAACTYLKKAKEQFGSWTLAAAAYNTGFTNVSRFLEAQYVDDYYDLYLSEETMRYVFRILAFKQILNNPEKYNFQIDAPYPSEPCVKVTVNSEIKDLAKWAQEHGISYKTLKRFNPWLRQTNLAIKKGRNKSYEILIPEQKELYE